MSNAVRTRFAPSPTGFLHIGGVRTALYCFLYAKRHGGQFLLRIEDTDLERSEQRFTDDIMASMKWLGLTWDEEPIYQSKRMDIYRKKTEGLVASGHAYRCYCTEAEVEAMRVKATAAGKRPQYDRTCREKNLPHKEGTPYVFRAKVPLDGYVEFEDLIRGKIRVENTEVDDFVLIRSNGAPTYNLSCVIDDVESRMTHIIRGDDHINNTPKQIHLYRFFKFDQPFFAHLPMILGSDKKKLSKRTHAVSTNQYRVDGYLPGALLNFLVRLGWSHGDQEVFTMEEMIQHFGFDHVQKAGAVFNTEKLQWLNGEHIRRATPEGMQKVVVEDYSDLFGSHLARVKAPLATKLVALIQPKVKFAKEMAEQLVPLVTPGAVEVDPSQLKWKDPAAKPSVLAAVGATADLLSQKINSAGPGALKERSGADRAWGNVPSLGDIGMGHTEIDAFLRQVCETRGIKLGDIAQPMRLAVTGRVVSAGLFEVLATLPWDVVEPRLRKAAAF
jgi:glutamyl-tRNA synthetase